MSCFGLHVHYGATFAWRLGGPVFFASGKGSVSRSCYQLVCLAPQFYGSAAFLLSVPTHNYWLAISGLVCSLGGAADLWSFLLLSKFPSNWVVEDTAWGFRIEPPNNPAVLAGEEGV
jgi:hypothetical protein